MRATFENDNHCTRRVWHLLSSTKGGFNRIRILKLINADPCNANQIASHLNIDYKTAIHHIETLCKNDLIMTDSKTYGATYFLTPLMEANIQLLDRQKSTSDWIKAPWIKDLQQCQIGQHQFILGRHCLTCGAVKQKYV